MALPMPLIEITGALLLPAGEVRFTFSRAGGPGGQNVNKVNSRATLWFDVETSPTLSEYQKIRIRQRLVNRIGKDGVLQVSAMEHRTQKANRDEALRRFTELLAWALAEKPPRKKTRVAAGVRERRLQIKKRRSQLKASRGGKDW
ncbi:MAG: alternative ribosome rescue aminoacyl-tRNA hydrolase ArfB [Desulfobulbaceae bacterium]